MRVAAVENLSTVKFIYIALLGQPPADPTDNKQLVRNGFALTVTSSG